MVKNGRNNNGRKKVTSAPWLVIHQSIRIHKIEMTRHNSVIYKQIPHFKICKVVPQVGNSLLERHSPHTTIPRYAAGMLGISTVLNKALIKTSLLSSWMSALTLSSPGICTLAISILQGCCGGSDHAAAGNP